MPHATQVPRYARDDNFKLRIVVFTAGEMTAVDRVFYERLANDPSIELAGIVIDEFRPKRKLLVRRIARAIREDGVRWIGFKLSSKLCGLADRAALAIADRVHGPRRPATELPAPIHRVSDIHSDASLALIRSLRPDLGVIVGGRILRPSVITIPARGTLNIHKRQLPDYRGGGPVGYWEILAGEQSIGVSIHYATQHVDAGPVVAQSTIAIEERDTLASLKLKADLRGAALYYEAIIAIAKGTSRAVPQDLARGRTYRAPSEFKVWRLQRKLDAPRPLKERLARVRVLAQYALLLPSLQRTRRRLIADRRAPIAIFFYHLVTGRAVNHMCLPLAAFAKQVEFLRRYYEILPLPETVARLRTGANDAVAASITFDDGYRDNEWAIEYLRYFRIPATFFVSIGHVLDGSAFEHDLRRGYQTALPMSGSDVRQLVADGFTVASHAVHHEDFGTLDAQTADRVLRESAAHIRRVCGVKPELFAFPKGKRGVNITAASFGAALQHYDAIFSAYGGYALPSAGARHFVRMSNPTDATEMSLAMSGYSGFRDCLRGNAWGLETATLDPRTTAAPPRKPSIAIVAASERVVGGHSVQARGLTTGFRNAGHRVTWIAVDGPLKKVPYVRTVVNQLLYLPSLLRIASADIVHVFAASYLSFLLGPAPAIVLGRLLRKRVIVHYHSGEADDHLTRWKRSVRPLLAMADEIVVPSAYLQRVFASHGYAARVIPNLVDTTRFPYRERNPLRPRLISVRNFHPYYQVENTIAAFARIQERYPDATLTIAGVGSEEEKLRRLAIGLRHVEFIGRVTQAELPAIYDQADIFVNSSIVDNQPVSILEAFASGLPVVSTPTGDIATMLRDGEAGLLVEPNDPDAMAGSVIRLLADSDLALRIARRAREQAAMHASTRVMEQWATVILSREDGEGSQVTKAEILRALRRSG